MKQYFKHTYKDIWKHVFQNYPNECCGLIVDGEYTPCKNEAVDPHSTFLIKKDVLLSACQNKLEAVIHSHVNYPYVSKTDMMMSRDWDVPWGIAFVDSCRKDGIFFWGDSLETQDFLERPFKYGVYDCYSLVRDYYRKELKIDLPYIASNYGWWNTEESYFEDLFKEYGFKKTDRTSYQIGDIFMWSIGERTLTQGKVNHIGVYVGNGYILHHMNGRLSGYCESRVWGTGAKLVVRKK